MVSTAAADPAAWSEWGWRTPVDECRASGAGVDPRERVDIASSLHGIVVASAVRTFHIAVQHRSRGICARQVEPIADDRVASQP